MDARKDDAELIQHFLKTRDPQTREEIILRYIPLVHFVLGRLGISQALGADYEDAASQGILGLIEAVDRYDASHGTQFSTYAILRIRGKVIDQLRSHDWLSRGARQRARQLQGAIDSFWEQYHRPPSDEELAELLQWDLEGLRQAFIDSSHVLLSLDTVITSEGDETISLHEILADEEQENPDALIETEELKEALIQIIRSLPEREQLVLSLYYYEHLTFKEIGMVLDVSESRVCQLHTKAILSLRSKLKRAMLQAENLTQHERFPRPHTLHRSGNISDQGGTTL
ncbi:MAG: RNA polymerase sigma factor for flagellar operon [Anaerolineae bacterium]|jgi:RNA polymerase sigma factor for flagellar operon FliA|nr:MAG: RNA polymerase sigma factor for flagellar operon [Anaerolineae bacterium]